MSPMRFLRIHEVAGQAENGHDFRSDGNHEMIFPGEAVDFAAQTDDDVAQGPVIHIHDAFPDDAAHVNAQALPWWTWLSMGCSQEVVGRRNSVHIACKMEVDIFHGENLE